MLLWSRRLILSVLITSHVVTGCSSWQVVSVSPRALVDSAHVSAVKVREKEGAKYVLEWPRIAGDSLIGTLATDQPADRRVKRLEHGIPLAAVDRVAVHRSNRPGTVVLGVVAAGAVAVGIFLFSGCVSDCYR